MNGYILIVDDEEDIRNLLGIYLENEGFKVLDVYKRQGYSCVVMVVWLIGII